MSRLACCACVITIGTVALAAVPLVGEGDTPTADLVSYAHVQDALSFDPARAVPRPVCHVSDFVLAAEPAGAGDFAGAWIVTLKMAVDEEVTISLYDSADHLVVRTDEKKFIVEHPALWSPESPAWYKVILSNGEEFVSVRFGFRVAETRDGVLILNGRPFPLKAVKLDAESLGAASPAQLADELKAAHANAALFDAPPAGAWLDVCDCRGLCLLAPTNVVAMRELNHPCVIPGAESNACRAFGADDGRAAAFRETQHRFQDWSVTPLPEFRKYVVRNRSVFTSAAGVTCRWTALRDGEPVASGAIPLLDRKYTTKGAFDRPDAPLSPQTEITNTVPEVVREIGRRGGEMSLRFRFEKGETLLADEQIDFPNPRLPALPPSDDLPSVTNDGDLIAFAARGATYGFSRSTGRLVSLKLGRLFKSEWLREPVDVACPCPTNLAIGACRLTEPVAVSNAWVFATTGADTGAAVRWTVRGDGVLVCEAGGASGTNATDAALSLRFALDADNPLVTWFGAGPGANDDGATGAFLGHWSAEAREFGRRARTRAVAFDAGWDHLSFVTLADPFVFSVGPCDAERTQFDLFPASGAFAFAIVPEKRLAAWRRPRISQ